MFCKLFTSQFMLNKEPVNKLPVRLQKAPLLEAVFEVRFSGTKSVGDLLPGLIYSSAKDEYSALESLPLSGVPAEVREKDPALRYASHKRLGTTDGRGLLIGDHVLAISQPRPYPGWEKFKGNILKILDIVKGTNLLGEIERYSLKCVNIIPAGPESQLDLLETKFEIAGEKPQEIGFQFRTERRAQERIDVIEIFPHASAKLPGSSPISGLMLGLDAIRVSNSKSFWANTVDFLEKIHADEKELFFRLLKPKTLEVLEPVWE